jgi:hypothetical protein
MKNLQQAIIDLHYIASTLPSDNDMNTRLRKIADELHEYVNADLRKGFKVGTHAEQQAWLRSTRKTEF